MNLKLLKGVSVRRVLQVDSTGDMKFFGLVIGKVAIGVNLRTRRAAAAAA